MTKRDFFYLIIIAVLGCALLLSRCNKGSGETSKSDTTKVIDTLIITYRDTIHSSGPVVIKTIPGKVPEFMQADTNYGKLKIQHEVLANNYFATNIQKRKFKKGNSWLELTDSVSQNRITGSNAIYELETVTVKETNTITNTIQAEQKRQFYLGGGITGNKINLINRFELGVLYKDRKDRMFGVKADMDVSGQVSYGVQSYWKIKLR